MKQILNIINVSEEPRLKAAASLTAHVLTISRLKHKPDLINVKSISPLPSFESSFNKNFEEVSLQRAQNLWLKNKDKELNVLWSGGIDSTLVLTAFFMTRHEGQKMNVFCNINSITENRHFYQTLLKDKSVRLLNSSKINSQSPLEFVTGDLGDQVFGSELIFRISRDFGFEKLFSPYLEVVPSLFKNICGENYGAVLFERFSPIVDECPFKIITAFDFIWWWNFTQKWQGVNLRKGFYLDGDHLATSFFDDDDFQRWSVFSHSEKIGKKIETYKMPAKKLIYAFDRNEDYLKFKKKQSSYFGGKIFSFGLYDDGSKIKTYSECLEALALNQLV